MARSYSHSRIGTFLNCPRQYKFQYVEKAIVEKLVSVEAFLGSAVHNALEKLYQHKQNGRVMPLEELIDIYARFWEGPDKDRIKVTRENLGVEDFIKVGRAGLEKFYQQYHPFDDGKTLALEKKITFPLDEGGRFSFTGKVDRLAMREDKTVEIIDYKTQSALPTQRDLETNDQMALYQIGIKHLWPDFEKIEVKQHFIRHGVTMSATLPDDIIEEIREATVQNILAIEYAVREDDFPVRESRLCDWCLYYDLCPAKRHKLALEGRQDEDFDEKIGYDLAGKYLELNENIKKQESELKALKADIVKFCDESGLTVLQASHGSLKVTSTETIGFPSKTADERAYLDLSLMLRGAGLDDCFKLDQNALYRDYYKPQRLPPDLLERLEKYLVRRRSSRISARIKKGDDGE
jgi:putative RecB family exonuclease